MVTAVITPAELELTLNDDTTADEIFDEVAFDDETASDDGAAELVSLLDCATLLGILDEAAVVVLPPPPHAVNRVANVATHSSN
jgi:hypothetical protein